MTLRSLLLSASWHAVRLLLRILSCLVPADCRESWQKEWQGELWQVRQASERSADLLRFAAGAIPDAIYLRLKARDKTSGRAVPASRCALGLLCVTAIATAIAWSLSSVRAEFRQSAWKSPEDLTILFLPNVDNEAAATITPERFLLWKERALSIRKIGFYQILDRDVAVHGRTVRLHLAHAAGDLVTMVGNAGLLQQTWRISEPRVVLSTRVWRHSFGADSSIVGTKVTVDGQSVRVSAIADLEDSGLPGDYDAWLFDDKPLQPGRPGFVLAMFAKNTPLNPYFGFEHFSVRERHDSEVSGLAFPVADRKATAWSALALGLGLSLLALPATIPLGFGEKARATGRASLLQVLQRWCFLTLKCMLLAVLASDTALIAGAMFPRVDWRGAVLTRTLVTLITMLLGLRWAVQDQRRRCPVCLKQLTNPARVGQPARNFLSWNGTELVCESGHGLMHVPAHATSWFGTQRWLALDASWQFLFVQKN